MTPYHNIKFREAIPEDVSLLRQWDSQPHIVESDPNDDWNWETELLKKPDWRELLIAEMDGRPIGFIQIIDPEKEETKYWGDVPPNLRALDIWIGDEKDLGQGFGTIMMKMALERCFANTSVTAVLIDPLESNTRACKFYERLGFKFIEKRTFGDDHCLVYRLSRLDWENLRYEVRGTNEIPNS